MSSLPPYSKRNGWRGRIAWRLRCWADRIDRRGAFVYAGCSFTFEDRLGMVLNDDDRGCPLWICGEDDYRLAHLEAETDHVILDFENGRVHVPGSGDWPVQEWG